MNIPIAPWRILQGEHGRRVERERRKREAAERAKRRKDRLHALITALVVLVAAFLLWLPTYEAQAVIGGLLAFGSVFVLHMWLRLAGRK